MEAFAAPSAPLVATLVSLTTRNRPPSEIERPVYGCLVAQTATFWQPVPGVPLFTPRTCHFQPNPYGSVSHYRVETKIHLHRRSGRRRGVKRALLWTDGPHRRVAARHDAARVACGPAHLRGRSHLILQSRARAAAHRLLADCPTACSSRSRRRARAPARMALSLITRSPRRTDQSKSTSVLIQKSDLKPLSPRRLLSNQGITT